MQFAKDSFYATLSDRLRQLNPSRTISVGGNPRAAILVSENEPINAAQALENTFHIIWGAIHICDGFEGAREPLFKIECSIYYGTSGTRDDALDRGRTIAELGSELLQIYSPPFAEKRDYTRSDAMLLNSRIFWTTPEIVPVVDFKAGDVRGIAEQSAPLFHVARLTMFFYPEVV